MMWKTITQLFVRHRHTVGEFVRFGVVGGINTGLDFAVYVGLTRGFAFWGEHFAAANVISFSLGVTSSFLLNNFWTFRKDGRRWHLRSARFLTVCVAALGWNSLVLLSLTSLGVHDLVAKLFATGAVGFWNFTMYKMWAFRT